MNPSTLRKMLHAANGKFQVGIVAFGFRHDYEVYKGDFTGPVYQAAVNYAMDGTIYPMSLSQCNPNKPKSPLIIPVIHCLTSDTKFSKVLDILNNEGYDGPFMFLPTRELYDCHST